MRIVVVGLGKVGRALTAQLTAENNDIVVIDQNPDLIEDIVNIYDVRGLAGNGGCYDVQKEAFEDGADLLIATTSSDEINILACLVAKKLGTQHTIARIRNPEYEKQLRFMRDDLGLSMFVNPEKATAREIARVLRFPSAIKREQFCRQRFELIEYRLADDNPLVGLQLSDLYRNIRVKILICAVARGSETIIPTGMFTLRAGDKIYLTASARDLEAFFRKLNLFKAKASNVMIVGASRMTYYLVKELQDIQKRVTVIDSDAARCQEMSEKFPGVLVIHGDGADAEGRDVLLPQQRIKGDVGGDGQLPTDVVAVDVSAGICLGIAQLLRPLQHSGKIRPCRAMASIMKLVVPFMMPPTSVTVSTRRQRCKFTSHGIPPPTAAVQRSATLFSQASAVSSR